EVSMDPHVSRVAGRLQAVHPDPGQPRGVGEAGAFGQGTAHRFVPPLQRAAPAAPVPGVAAGVHAVQGADESGKVTGERIGVADALAAGRLAWYPAVGRPRPRVSLARLPEPDGPGHRGRHMRGDATLGVL